MLNVPETPRTTDPNRPASDAARAASELERVLASPEFHGSQRAQRLLRYLVEHVLSGDVKELKERCLGMELFGRDAGYDTTRDSIVRVAATDLRKRLAAYYERADACSPRPSVRFLLPAGSYLLDCQWPGDSGPPPEATPKAESAVLSVEPAPPSVRRSARTWRLAAALAAMAVIGLALWLVGGRGEGSRSAAETLWDQMFLNGRPTCVVLCDANLAQFQELIHSSITLNEYKKRQFPEIADRRIADQAQLSFAKLVMTRVYTSIADAAVAAKIGMLDGARQIRTDVVYARNFGTAYFDTHNVILLGSRRANPWINLFENQMNFRAGYREDPPTSYFENVAPRPGEARTYTGAWESTSYLRLAFLPNPHRDGTVLIISGTEMTSSLAAGDFLSSNTWIRKLRALPGLAGKARLPYFEVLLRTEQVVDVVPKLEIVAYRTYER